MDIDLTHLKLASLGSICVFEHMFDIKQSHKQAIPYKGIINTDYILIRDTPLNGGKPTISNVISCLSDKNLFIDNLRITSNYEWLCHDLMHFVIHNGYCRKYFSNIDDFFSNNIVNIKVDKIIFDTTMNDKNYIKYENSWNITKNTITKLHTIAFNANIFK